MATACAPALAAPPRLIASWPAAGASLPIGPHLLELTFNRPLQAGSTWVTVSNEGDRRQTATDSAVDAMDSRRLTVRLLEPSGGQYRLQWHAVAARTAAAMDGELEFSLEAESHGAPRLNGSSAAAEGDNVEVVGNGFKGSCWVRLKIGDDELSLSTVETDTRGTFIVQTPLPPGVPFGIQPVTASDGCGGAATGSVYVRWGSWPPLSVGNVGQPGPGAGEVTFSVIVRNRSDYLLERVRVVLADPQGTSFVAADPSPRRQPGSVAWDVPELDRGVFGPFRATYRSNAAITSHARVEFRHRTRGCSDDECLPAFVNETTSDSTPVYPAD